MSISNSSLDRLTEKVHVLNHEKKQRLRKVCISLKLVISL
jgi:Ase1/PRC1/MAP65 family protein